jgi:hypothetical protein
MILPLILTRSQLGMLQLKQVLCITPQALIKMLMIFRSSVLNLVIKGSKRRTTLRSSSHSRLEALIMPKGFSELVGRMLSFSFILPWGLFGSRRTAITKTLA